MKKFGVIFLAVVIVLASLLPNFLLLPKNTYQKVVYAESIEDEFYTETAVDLISINPSSVSSATIETEKAPFDEKTKTRMPGSIITPNADDYGQISGTSFATNAFSPTSEQSVFLWIYLIDALKFRLTISILDNASSTLTWSFNENRIEEMGPGWKLFELRLKDLQTEDDYSTKVYQFIRIKYVSYLEDFADDPDYQPYDIRTNERLSFYHVFLDKNAENSVNSGNIYNLDRVNYKYNDNFLADKTVFKGDKMQILSPSVIFEYLYIGKYDLSNLSVVGKYEWRILVSGPNSSDWSEIEFGDTISFSMLGFYRLSVQIYENSALSDRRIFNVEFDVYSQELSLGRFVTGTSYKIKNNENITIRFKLNSGIELQSELSVEMSNNNANVKSYYIEDDYLYVTIEPVSNGSSKLEISAEAKSQNNTKIVTCVSEATITIDKGQGNDLFMIILWVSFACFCIGITIYLLISVVKARDVDVK